MPTSKPSVTAEHHERFKQIMQTPTRPNVPDATVKQSTNPSKVSALLASLPKPKGIGNKMFVFTGKKKIVLDPAGNQDVEKIKTVDAPPLKPKPAPPPPEIPKKVDPESLIARNIEVENRTEEKKKPKEIKETKGATEKNKQRAKITPGMVLVGIIILLGVWTLFWLYFLEYI